jgi:hypothetical protein
MMRLPCLFWSFVTLIAISATTYADGRYFEVEYPPSEQPGELIYGVTYTVWIPERVKTLRGVIVHQHGCGRGACEGGATAGYDLHWQALARKWDCALLGPSYHQADGQDCRKWCDPRNGSEKTFLKGLVELGIKSQHPELSQVPWCLWGHSGGGFWASLMQTSHPERIVAIWFRSGTAFATWEKGEIPKPEIPAAAYEIPMMLNPGAKEKDDPRFASAWTGSMAMFEAYRAKGAVAGFAPDPRTAHECGDSRYLAIPFFDACLELRLPAVGTQDQKLRPIDKNQSWLAPVLGQKATPAESFTGNAEQSGWLPNEKVARAWEEYVATGATSDTTAPAPPFLVTLQTNPNEAAKLTWDAHADFESGLQGFTIERDGNEIARVPEKSIGRFGRPLFQSMSYHDTPDKSLPQMQFVDKDAQPGVRHEYRVTSINSVGLKSEPATAAAN